jgi:hypothetical protein
MNLASGPPHLRELMTPDLILQALTRVDFFDAPLPKRALRAASRRRAEMLPLFLTEVEKFVAASPKARLTATPVLFIFFLLGEWRDTVSYQPLARLISCPEFSDRPGLESVFDEIGHLVMAAVFDGDPLPLYNVVLDTSADRICRHDILSNTLRLLAYEGRIDRESIADFLIEAFDLLDDRPIVWRAWAYLAASLNLSALRPLVKMAIADERMDDYEIKEFDDDLAKAAASPNTPDPDENFSAFRDACSELKPYFSVLVQSHFSEAKS